MAVSRTTAWVIPSRSGIPSTGPTARRLYLLVPGPVTDQAPWTVVIRHARCADGSLDPRQWFPVSAEAGKARQEAAAAIAICATCLVRAECLALSLGHWDISQHGVWRVGRSRTCGIAPRTHADSTSKALVNSHRLARRRSRCGRTQLARGWIAERRKEHRATQA